MALTAQRKPTVHHKKRQGAHHRHSKHYLRTYAPYLPLLMLVIIGLAVNSFWSARTHVLGAATSLTANELLQDTNLERAHQQEPDLVVNQALNQAAQLKANDMVQRDYWSHNAPDGTTPWSFMEQTGYDYQAAGENLAYGFMNAGQIIGSWMNSPEHRANILNRDYQEIGFGITRSDNYLGHGPATIVVAMYGEPSGGVSVHASVSGTHDILGSAISNQPYRTVSRVQLLTGGAAPWSFAALSLLMVLALCFLVFRHALAWHRVLIKSEDFVVGHKVLDLVLLSLLLIGFLLTRSAGFIY